MPKYLTSLIIFTVILSAGIALAQTEATEDVDLDENIQAQDLGVSDPTILPDSPFYFFKNLGRGIRSALTFNPIAKAELKLKFSGEKLVEAKKLAEKNKKPEILANGLENYQTEVNNLKTAVDGIKEKAKDNPKISAFLDKFIKQQILHQRILQKLESQVSPEVLEKIKAIREKHLEKFGQVMEKLGNKEELRERLEKNLEELPGSKFKHFKNLEILMRLEEKVPEEAKEAIQKAQENSLKRLQAKFEQMSSEQQEKFKLYVNEIQGDSQKKAEILENLRSELKEKPQLREKLLETRDKILNKVENKNCPAFTPPRPGFCKDGRIIIKKSEQGCPVAAECLIPGEFNKAKTACITLWDPVCGKDRRTYSNKCFATAAGVEIASPGECGTGR